MLRDPRAYLWDVERAAESIETFAAGSDAAHYARDALVRAAVERQFEIIGEALSRLVKSSPDLAQLVPHLRDIIAFRNVLIRCYATIDHARVWHVREAWLPSLHATISALLTAAWVA